MVNNHSFNRFAVNHLFIQNQKIAFAEKAGNRAGSFFEVHVIVEDFKCRSGSGSVKDGERAIVGCA